MSIDPCDYQTVVVAVGQVIVLVEYVLVEYAIL